MKRYWRICWPPDRVCMQGGCLWCQDAPKRTVSAIRSFAQERGWMNDFHERELIER